MGYDYTHISAAGQTDVGHVRQHNEDSTGVHSENAGFCVGGEKDKISATQLPIDESALIHSHA